MALELEAPSVESLDSHAARATAAGLRLAKPEAGAAVNLLDADATGDEQRTDSTPITVRLVKPVADPVAGFEGNAGDAYDAYTDTGGNTWIPLPDGDICLEAEEFEIVEPLADAETAETEVDAAPGALMVAAERIADDFTADPPAAETPSPTPATPKPAAVHWDAHARRRADYLREKDVLQEQISALMIEQAKLKEQAKKCKKEAEVYIDQLNALIEGWDNPAPSDAACETAAPTETAGGCGPLADQAAATSSQSQPEPASQPGEPSQEAATQAPPPAVQSEAATARKYEAALKAVTLESLGIGGKLLEKLQEERVLSIWDWEDLRKAIGLGRKEWPKGIGEKKREDVDARIGDWVAKNSHRWTPAGSVEAVNDAIEQQQDAERAADVAESQSGQPAEAAPAVSSDIDDL